MGHYLKSKPGSIEEAVSSVQSRPFIEDKEAYEKFFNSALKRFKVKSPADFKSDEEKKKFFNYIDKNYKSDAEKKTGKEDPKESKTLTGKKMSEIETNKIETKEENELDEMKKVEIKLNRGNVDRDIQKIVNHINLINKKSRPNQRIKITQNMSDDSVTLDGGKNVDIGREVADIKNFIGFKSAKVVEGKEENDLISLASKALSKVWGEAVEEKKMSEVETNKIETKEENELTEKVDKKLALKILSMVKTQKFKKTSGDFVPQIYLSGMDRDKLKKEFGRLPRGLPSASSGVPVVDFINHAMGISKTVDGIDTEDGDKPQPKLYDYRSGKVIGKPKTVGDAAKMAGLRLEEKKPFVETMRMALSQVWGEAVEEKMKMEQRRVPDATIKKFADMTDKNQHTEVRLQIAKVVGDKNLIKKYEKLKKDQDKAGSLTGRLQMTRQALDKDLLKKAFDELDNAKQVMSAL